MTDAAGDAAQSDPGVLGRVEEIHLYPVKSLAGATVTAVEARADGLAGDRAHVVVGADGAPLRSKGTPQLAGIAATGNPSVDEAAVRQALGEPVRLVPAPAGAGGAAVHLVSRQAVDRAAGGEVPEGCSAEDPRANLVLELTGAGGDERAWVSRRVRVGEAVLELTRLPKHCLGIYAEVRRPGRVRVGDLLVAEES